LISDIYQDEVEQVKIIPSIKSDHSAIVLLFNGIEEQRHGPSHWKFNSNLTNDEEYIKLITKSIPVWIEEFKDVSDKITQVKKLRAVFAKFLLKREL